MLDTDYGSEISRLAVFVILVCQNYDPGHKENENGNQRECRLSIIVRTRGNELSQYNGTRKWLKKTLLGY